MPRVSLQRVPAPALVLVGIASVQTGSAIARTLFDDLGVAGTALWRLILAALILLAVVRPRVRTWTGQQWRAAALLGVALAGMNLVFYFSLNLIPLGVAVTVEFLGPLLLALVQTRRALDLAWAMLAAAGVLLLGLDSSGHIAIGGLVLAFLAGLFWAGYILSSAHVGQVLPGINGLAVALVFSALIALPFGANGATAAFSDPALLIGALAVALLSSVIPYGLDLMALRRLPTRIFGVLMCLQPGAAAIAGWLILDQALGGRQVAALIMVSSASAGITLGRKEGAPPMAPLE
jgi:inner membrane transporter RhtA